MNRETADRIPRSRLCHGHLGGLVPRPLEGAGGAFPGARARPAGEYSLFQMTVSAESLFLPQETDPAGEHPALIVAKCQKVGGIAVVIDEGVVVPASHVVEASADRPMIAEGMKAFFDVGVERKPGRKAARPGGLDQLEPIVDDIEGETGSEFSRISEVESFVDRQQTPGQKTVGSIPRIRSRLLGAELRIVDANVEHLVRAGMGAHVGGEEHVPVAEGAAGSELEGVVVILSRVLEHEIAIEGCGIDKVVNQAVGTTLLDIFDLEVNGGWELAFERQAPVDETGGL